VSIDLLNRVLAGRYRVSGEIGRGGTATVYRAHDLKHDREVALKVLEPHLAAELGTERFLREIRFTARLDHPHILPLLDSGEADGVLYYVMPFVEDERAVAHYPRQGFAWTLARTYALTGHEAKARKILGSLESGVPTDVPHPWFVAAAYAALGDHEKAIDWLETAYAQRILFLTNLRRDRAAGATFGALRGNTRFQSLLRRLRITGAA
jgi:hypothetical protein